jgi:hypothetical protein
MQVSYKVKQKERTSPPMSKICILLACAAMAASGAAAQVINAASCSQANVQTALNNIAANGTTVNIPSGNCTWSGNISFSTPYSFTLKGQSTATASDSHGNPTSFSDTTVITDGQSGTGGNNSILSIGLTGSSSQVARMTGFTIHGGNVVYNGEITIDGNAGTQARVDHNHIVNINDLAFSMYEPMTGVADHNLFDVPAGVLYNGIRVYNTGDSYGDAPWTKSPGYGSSSFVFIENNTFNNGFMNDCESGGAFVARYNTFNVTVASGNIGIQSHATGSQPRDRGCRVWEVYGNWAGGGGGTVQFTVGFQTSGTGMWWGNTIINSGFDLALVEDRDSTTYSQTATPNGWGYCGSAQNGRASGWDENSTSSGYACIDQIGRGKGDLLSGYWPNVQNNTSPGVYTGVWPHQAVEPVYIWGETFSGGTLVTVNSSNNNIQANRDYYAPATSFNGTVGTGTGLFSARPSTCTAGAGSTPGVGYWATDQNTLYVCTATNTWTEYYKPYTYPHPLTQSGSVQSPANPSGLTGKYVVK